MNTGWFSMNEGGRSYQYSSQYGMTRLVDMDTEHRSNLSYNEHAIYPYAKLGYTFHLKDSRLRSVFGDEHTHGGEVFTTGRSSEEYRHFFPDLPDHPEGQVVEVGPGASEYLTQVALNRSPGQPKPIAIDVVDYEALQTMLAVAETLDIFSEARDDIQKWQRRIAIYTNPELITLYNLPLSVALARHTTLHQCADLLIDHWASDYYHTAEGYLFNMERLTDQSRTPLPNDTVTEVRAEIDGFRSSLLSATGTLLLRRREQWKK